MRVRVKVKDTTVRNLMNKFFDNWKLHAKVDSDNNVNVLNAN